ncbi:putativeLTR transposable element [Pseudoloma neurophilia]|uniref:PutativeLTR transposable element n=1 Tax=Pseudoloma neurophilia TaxID=146866 RepID=A0A0R0LWK6_9MICR|nr:putativeLTR transposable element [Pseudoloma neurophilia]
MVFSLKGFEKKLFLYSRICQKGGNSRITMGTRITHLYDKLKTVLLKSKFQMKKCLQFTRFMMNQETMPLITNQMQTSFHYPCRCLRSWYWCSLKSEKWNCSILFKKIFRN